MAFKRSAMLVLLVAVVVILVIEPHLTDAGGGGGGGGGGGQHGGGGGGGQHGGGGGGGQHGGGGGGQHGGGGGGQHGGGGGGQHGGGGGGGQHGGGGGGQHGGGGGGGQHGGGGGGGQHGGGGGGGQHGGGGGGGQHGGGGGGGQHGGGGGGGQHGGGGGGGQHGGGGGGGQHGGPDCHEWGSLCGDPKIVGGDGVTFYFHGRKNQDFCLVSDSDLHINAHFIGKRPLGRTHDFTWVQALSFVSGPHTVIIATRKVALWDNQIDQLELSYNGQSFELDQSWASPDATMVLSRIGATNSVDLVVKEKMGVALTVVPIGKEENEVHKYGLTDDDCFAHFDMQFRFHNLSSFVNGVLGQTYQPGFVNPVKRGVPMPIMGRADRFRTSSLVATDCPTTQYTGSAIAMGSAMPSFTTSCGSSGLPNGVPGGMTCRR